jgi:Pyruvate/2-oxoacid:ferredoxin oxidoreductase delta subunit
MSCFICLEDIKYNRGSITSDRVNRGSITSDRVSRCTRCNVFCHDACWNQYIYRNKKKVLRPHWKILISCPICKRWIREKRNIIETRSMTLKKRHNEADVQLRFLLLSLKHITDIDTRLCVIQDIFEIFRKYPHIQKRNGMMEVVRNTLRNLYKDGWNGAPFYYYQLYQEILIL